MTNGLRVEIEQILEIINHFLPEFKTLGTRLEIVEDKYRQVVQLSNELKKFEQTLDETLVAHNYWDSQFFLQLQNDSLQFEYLQVYKSGTTNSYGVTQSGG